MMKYFSAMALAVLVSSAAFAAPMLPDSAAIAPVVETAGAGNRNSTSTFQENTDGGDTGGGALPEPATMALLGIGLGLAGMARRNKK